jgi:uncharacterized protein (DUF2249 family)
MGTTHELDVHELQPPEPMVRILSMLPTLGPDDALIVTHHREPIPLYAHLEAAGFSHSIETLPNGQFRLTIRRQV